jgi:hypothetical protein
MRPVNSSAQRPTLAAPERKIIILEQEHAHPVTMMQIQHFLDHLGGLAHPHHLAGRRAVERVYRAERAATDAAAAGKHRQRRKSPDALGLSRTIRERQRIEIGDQRPGRCRDDRLAAAIGDAVEFAPILARAKLLTSSINVSSPSYRTTLSISGKCVSSSS